MRKTFTALFLALFSISIAFSQDTLTAGQVLGKAVSLITQAKGIETKFTVTNSGFSGGGLIKASGKKFKVIMPDVEVWYNGKDLYTYSKRSGETTVVVPTTEELSQSNPLAYVTGASGNYNVKFSTVKKTGKYVLELTPKQKSSEIKRITLTLNKTDYTPQKIVVEPASGTPITSEISSFQTSKAINDSEFNYPKSKYPNVEIIDLR